MNRRYRKKRAVRTDNTNTPIVWMLIGKNEMNEEICLQVGRNKNLQRMLSTDIRLDVHEIRSGDENTKYGQLVKEYRALEFYEIDIDNYLKEDDVFCKCFGQIPQNEYLASAYFTLRAAYVEGKVVAEYGCRKEKDNGRMWCPSPDGLDGSFYEYWKKVNEGNLG